MSKRSHGFLLCVLCGLGCSLGCSEETSVDRTESDSGSALADASPDTNTTDDTGAMAETAPTDAGTEADCLPATVSAPYLTALDPTKCIVGDYRIDAARVSATWGRHNGPLVFAATGGEARLMRYELAATPTGTLLAKTQVISMGTLPSGIFFNSEAVDLPFFGWTAFAYTGTAAAGELFLADSAGVKTRYKMRGLYGVGGVGDDKTGRLFYTGLSELDANATPTTKESALWGADTCGTAASMPRLIPSGDGSCKAPTKVGTWQPSTGSSGPVAVDSQQNVFAVLNGSAQELRGLERSAAQRGAGPAGGVALATSMDYFSAVAADGRKVFWLADGFPAKNVDVKSTSYTVDPASKSLMAGDTATPFQLVKAGSVTSMFTDNRNRLWVGFEVTAAGDAGSTSTAFLVIRDKKPTP